MCSCMFAVTTAWFAGEFVPSPKAYEGVCEPFAHTRLWPRKSRLLLCAKATWLSAVVYVKLPFVFSTELHFMSLPETTLLKCFVSNCACTPLMSDESI